MATRRGTAGDDVLRGTSSADKILGRGGNDLIDPGLGADIIDGGAGDDTVRFSSVMSSSPPPSEVGRIDGGRGYDTIDARFVSPVSFGGSADQITMSIGSQSFAIGGIEEILLGSYNDFVTLPIFYAGPNVTLRAGDGNDYLSAGGNYSIYGDGGDDYFFASGSPGGTTSGSLDGGDGYDTLGLNYNSVVDLKAGTVTSYGASYTVVGFEAVSAMSDSVVFGSDDADEMAVRDIFDSGSASIRFEGRGGADTLSGSQGNDTIDGGDGADLIRGSGGADTLTGGAGRDVFVFDGDDSSVGGEDTITDFVLGEDRIDLSRIDANPSTPEHDRLRYIGQQAFNGNAGEVRFERQGRMTFVQLDLDGDGQADQVIQLASRTGLKASSFILKPGSAEVTQHDFSGHGHGWEAGTHLGLGADLP